MSTKAMSFEKHFNRYLQGVGVSQLVAKINAQELLLKSSNRASNTMSIVSGLRYVCGKELLAGSFAHFVRQSVNDKKLELLFSDWTDSDTRDFINGFSESKDVGSEVLIAFLFHDYLAGRYDAATDETMFNEYTIKFANFDVFKKEVALFYTQFFHED